MDFESVQKTASRLGCTVRAVQKWAKEGKIPFAFKDGRDWKIPTTYVNNKNVNLPLFFKNEPLPLIHPYTTGNALKYIESIEDEDDRNMAYCQYYYYIGELKQSTIIAEPYLDSKNPILRSTAAFFCIFANLCRGHLQKCYYAQSLLVESLRDSLSGNTTNKEKAVNVLVCNIVKMKLHLTFSKLPFLDGYMKYLDEGIRLYACYLKAYDAYLKKDYSKSLGVVETAFFFDVDAYPLPTIYLHLIAAMDLINLMQTEKAIEHIEKAWALASPDGFFMPFVEHYNLLQGLIEKHIKKNHPKDYSKIIGATKQYNTSWYEVYNRYEDQSVATNLTHTEFTIAMLYSRSWRVKEIAAHLELSERTIMNYITVIYDKLHINGKKELEQFMLK